MGCLEIETAHFYIPVPVPEFESILPYLYVLRFYNYVKRLQIHNSG